MRTLFSGGPARTTPNKTKLSERAANRFAGSRAKKFLSYYRPYRGLLLADLVSAFVISAAALLLPVCTNFITKKLLRRRTRRARQDLCAGRGDARAGRPAGPVHVVRRLPGTCDGREDGTGHAPGAVRALPETVVQLLRPAANRPAHGADHQRSPFPRRALSSRAGRSRDREPGADRGADHPRAYRHDAHADGPGLHSGDVRLRAAFQQAHDRRAQIEQGPDRRHQRAGRRFARGDTGGEIFHQRGVRDCALQLRERSLSRQPERGLSERGMVLRWHGRFHAAHHHRGDRVRRNRHRARRRSTSPTCSPF